MQRARLWVPGLVAIALIASPHASSTAAPTPRAGQTLRQLAAALRK